MQLQVTYVPANWWQRIIMGAEALLVTAVRFWNDKVLFHTDDKVAFEDACCCDCLNCGDIVIPAGNIEISGYSDGDLTACVGCDADTTSDIWPGDFEDRTGCLWTDETPPVSAVWRISSKAHVLSQVQVFQFNPCHKRLTITCGVPAEKMWEGELNDGSQLVTGVYTRTSGCDTTGTLTIVES